MIIRETTGYEEDTLDDDALSTTERITRVLSACTEKIGEVEDKALISRIISDTLAEGEGHALTQADRLAMMLFVRRITNGDVYHLGNEQRRCPACRKQNAPQHINLSNAINIKSSPNPMGRLVEVTLPRSQVKAKIKVLSAQGESAIGQLVRRSKENRKDLRSLVTLVHIESLDDKPIAVNDPESLRLVKSLSSVDRDFIRQVYNKIEGSIDTELEMTCQNLACGREWKTDIDIGQVFFSPQGATVSDQDLTWI